MLPSHGAFSLPGPGYATTPKPCRPPDYGRDNKICGPDVSEWYAADLCEHFIDQESDISVWQDRHRYANLLSYKWMRFESSNYAHGVPENEDACPVNCPNTVTLCGRCVPKNQLGNVAYAALVNVNPPFGNNTTGWIKYVYEKAEIGRYPGKEHPHWDPLYKGLNSRHRRDNIAAFAVGVALGSAVKGKHKDRAKCKIAVMAFLCGAEGTRNYDIWTRTDEYLFGGYYWLFRQTLINANMYNELNASTPITHSDFTTMATHGGLLDVGVACTPCGLPAARLRWSSAVGRGLVELYTEHQRKLFFENYQYHSGAL